MTPIPAWRRYARFFGADISRDVDDELRFHLEEKTRALIEKGLDKERARAEALRQFGRVDDVRRLCQALGHSRERKIERRNYWSGWWHDLRYAARTLRKAPLVTAVAVLSIALGIGANTAVFTLFDQVMLRKLPVADADRIVRVATQGFYYGSTHGTGRELSYRTYVALRDHNNVFAGIFGLFPFSAAANAGGRAEMAAGELVTGSYFQTLGVGAIRGRVIGPEDDIVPGGHSVVVISYRYWQRRFSGETQIVGRKLTINNQPMTIIGVLEPRFDGMSLTTATQLFVPVTMERQMIPTGARLTDRGLRWLKVYARLKPGITLERAQASLEPFYRRLREEDLNDVWFARAAALVKRRYLNDNHIQLIAASEGYTPLRGELRRPLWMLMATVCGVLLIACANVANLLLARGASRQREVALRLSLGATRGRIIRQLLVESVMLSIVGGLAGLLLATVGVWLLIALFADPETVTSLSATPDIRILCFTGAVTLLTGLLFGIVPAFQATKLELAPTLKDQAGSVLGGGHVRMRKTFVVSEVALSLLLLIGAGLFIRSLHGLMNADLGFESGSLMTFAADPTLAGYKDARAKQYALDVLSKVRATPGVTAAGFARIGLLWGGAWGSSITVEGYRHRDGEDVSSRCNAVSPGYFEALGIPLLIGRDFSEADARIETAEGRGETEEGDSADEGYRVAIASESFVRRYMAGNPIGRHIGFGNDPGTPTRIEIVGVVKDSTYTSPTEERQWQLYFPFLESSDASGASFYVRTASDPDAMLQTIGRVMRAVDPDVPPLHLRTMDRQLQRSLANQRMVTALSTIFGILATALAMVGLYGVMAYSVTRRTREIGVRIALGAMQPSVLWLIMREALTLVAVGIAIGLPVAWWLGRYVRSELYGTRSTDPVTISAAVLGLTLVAAVAGLVPAMRGARISPIRALREE